MSTGNGVFPPQNRNMLFNRWHLTFQVGYDDLHDGLPDGCSGRQVWQRVDRPAGPERQR